MEPSVTLAATILESYLGVRDRQCTNQSAVHKGRGSSFFFFFLYPSYNHNSSVFAFATGLNSSFSFPCSLWQGCRKKRGGCHGNRSFPGCGWFKLVTCSFPACDRDKTGKYCNADIKCRSLKEIMQINYAAHERVLLLQTISKHLLLFFFPIHPPFSRGWIVLVNTDLL